MSPRLLGNTPFTYPQLILFSVCAVVWILLSGLLLCVFFESKAKRLYPQYVIIAFFVCGVFTRGLWFALYPYETHLGRIGKISMLFDFSAVSLLVVLWSRSIHTHNVNERSSSIASRTTATPAPSELTINGNSIASRATTGNNNNPTTISAASLHANNAQTRNREQMEQQVIKKKHTIWRVVNVIVWTYGILSDFVFESSTIIIISGLCLIISVLMLYIGLANFKRVSTQLHHFYGKLESDPTKPDADSSITVYEFVFGDLKALDNKKGHRHLRLQIEALRTVLRVSFVVSMCYLLQGLAFFYIVLVRNEDVDGFSEYNFTYDFYIVMLFGFMFPCCFPSLVITHAISPNTSVIRKQLFCNCTSLFYLLGCISAETIRPPRSESKSTDSEKTPIGLNHGDKNTLAYRLHDDSACIKLFDKYLCCCNAKIQVLRTPRTSAIEPSAGVDTLAPNTSMRGSGVGSDHNVSDPGVHESLGGQMYNRPTMGLSNTAMDYYNEQFYRDDTNSSYSIGSTPGAGAIRSSGDLENDIELEADRETGIIALRTTWVPEANSNNPVFSVQNPINQSS